MLHTPSRSRQYSRSAGVNRLQPRTPVGGLWLLAKFHYEHQSSNTLTVTTITRLKTLDGTVPFGYLCRPSTKIDYPSSLRVLESQGRARLLTFPFYLLHTHSIDRITTAEQCLVRIRLSRQGTQHPSCSKAGSGSMDASISFTTVS